MHGALRAWSQKEPLKESTPAPDNSEELIVVAGLAFAAGVITVLISMLPLLLQICFFLDKISVVVKLGKLLRGI